MARRSPRLTGKPSASSASSSSCGTLAMGSLAKRSQRSRARPGAGGYGTLAFTHGVGLYSNLLALEDEHGIAVGVINVPALGESVYAARGLGCFCNGVRAQVSERAELAESYLSASSFGDWDETALLGAKRAGLQLRTWGDGYGYSLVATGRVDAMVDVQAATHDLAAMPVIISEAGGRFTDLGGAPGPDGGSGVASNGRIHDALLRLLVRS